MNESEEKQLLAVVAGLVPANAMQVSAALGKLSTQLDELTTQLTAADVIAVDAEEAHDKAFDLAYVSYMEADTRLAYHSIAKAKARVDTADLRLTWRVAEREVRRLDRRCKTLDRRIDVGRTVAATVRSEHRAIGYGGAA